VEVTRTNVVTNKAGGSMRKRVLAQTVAAAAAELEIEMRSPKVLRLSSGRSSPGSASESLYGDGDFESEYEHFPDMTRLGPGLGPGPDGEAWLPMRTGPTVVRLFTPSDMGSDGLGPADDF
jgi:hypothetical protein